MDGSAKVSLILELKERIKAGLNQAKNYVNQNVKEMKESLNSLKETHVKAFEAMKDEVPGFARVVELAKNPYVLVTAAVLALGVAYQDAVKDSIAWEAKMAHANVTAQESKAGLKNLSDELREIGSRNVAPLETVPDAFNRIISAGLTAKQALEALEPTLRASKAGFTDMETTAAAGVGVMNSSGEDINKVFDVLFATVNKGNAEFKDIAQYLPKIIPNAKAAGFALGETAGAWAYLTAQGRNAEQSTTGLLNTFKALSNPDTFKGLKDIGVKVFDTTGKVRPLVDIISQLSGKMNGLSDQKRAVKMGGLGIDMEGLGAINSMMQDTKKLKETIDFTTNSTGALNQAYKDAHQSTDTWAIISNKFKVVMLQIGDTALPIIEAVGNGVVSVIQWFKDLYNSSALVRDIIAGLGHVMYAAFELVVAPLKIIWAMLKGLYEIAKPFGEMFFGSIENAYRSIRPYLTYVYDLLTQIADIAYKFITLDFAGAWKGVQDFKMPDMGTIKKKLEIEYNSDKPKDAFEEKKKTADKPTKKDNKLATDSVNKITDGSQHVRNITVNIDAFNKGGINTNNTQGMNGMSAKDIEAWMEAMLKRMIANLETSYS